MHWRIKGVVQKALGWIPAGGVLHYRLQRHLGGLRDFNRELETKIDDWTIMASHLRHAGVGLDGARLMEIGSGWYPTFPIACHLAGAASVVSFDLNRHLRPELTLRCIEGIERHLARLAEASETNAAQIRARWEALNAGWRQHRDIMRASGGGILYRAPADASKTDLPDAACDAVFSNSVLEHVPLQTITPLYREAFRVLRPSGLMFHSVNCGDHYAYTDRRINQLHYLRYSDAQWRFWDNAFLYQNRLRAHRFVELALEAGYEIVLDTSKPTETRLAQLRKTPLAPQFVGIDEARLCITTVDFIGRKP